MSCEEPPNKRFKSCHGNGSSCNSQSSKCSKVEPPTSLSDIKITFNSTITIDPNDEINSDYLAKWNAVMYDCFNKDQNIGQNHNNKTKSQKQESNTKQIISQKIEFASNIIATASFYTINAEKAIEDGTQEDLITAMDETCVELEQLSSLFDPPDDENISNINGTKLNLNSNVNLFDFDILDINNSNSNSNDDGNMFRFSTHNQKPMVLIERNNSKVGMIDDDDKTDSKKDGKILMNNNNLRSLHNNDFMNQGECFNILHIEQVQIANSKYFGFGYGRLLTQKIIDNFANGNGTRVTLKPYPLQHTKYDANQATNMRFKIESSSKCDYIAHMEKIQQVWESMGFVQICQSKFWGRNQLFRHPTVYDFCVKLYPCGVDQ